MIFKHIFRRRASARIYLDYASSTPIDEQMLGTFPRIPKTVAGANPSALHAEGVALKTYLSIARKCVADTLLVHPDEIIFTSGATESDNLAIIGTVRKWIESGIEKDEIVIAISDIEHAAVSESAKHVGVHQQLLETKNGVLDPKDIIVPEGIKALFISAMFVSNEIGTVQPIKDIAKRVRYLRKHHPDIEIVFHVDATQAPLYYELRIPSLGVDMMTLGATKLYCPKGVGILYKKRSIEISPIMYGGGQEFGLRPGTESVQLIHDFAYALSFAQSHYEQASLHTAALRDYFEHQLNEVLPRSGMMITASAKERSPHISHIAISHFDSELLVIELDARGIAVSAKSACKNEEDTESPIVERIYGPNVGALRFSFGRMTTKKDVDRAIDALKDVLQKYLKY